MVQVVCFGFDIWGGQVQHQQSPELFSFVKKQALVVPNCPTNRTITVSFHLPLSVEAFAQMEQLQLVNNQPISDNPDWWQYIWENTQFSSKKAYLHLTGHAQVPRLSNGYGNLVVKTNTKFSSGCYSRIALAREIY